MSRMTKIYWRSSKVPAWGLILLAGAALLVLGIAEGFLKRDPVVEENYATMVAASRTMRDAIEVIRPIRGRVEPINPTFDPQRSGLIGVASSEVTTTRGGLQSKQTTVNPNWGAVAVKLLLDAGVESGDKVAVTVSGSFPGMNLAVYSALQAMDVEPIIISSGSSSQWGANVPGMLWTDMERELRNADVLNLTPVAASIGGVEDRGVDLSDQGINIIRRSIQRAGIPFLEPGSYQEAVADRIALFREHSGGEPIKAFVNVGGGATIVGPPGIDSQFSSGLSRSAPPRAFAVETVMGYFLREGVPAIHFIGINNMAERHGLPIASEEPVPVGSGGIYSASTYRRGMAAVLGLFLIGLTWLMVHSAGITALWSRSGEGQGTTRPMV
ncbi:poly-gamma-glutamate system protein [Natronospira proteinivora]|uniref:Poly-gamma-glutamate system protein n=1 Tax=Natronospira proteinivora TaxID=1807133 RepID=A0ABT1G954_9GAMM|nr:poly-gamma-glutamate system protein [Natronospira proteinivora]MCP1726858.1 poly-gamma-glutamate system protein [Natronospira proteinivora]